jgi:hypothetical protein
MKLSIDKLMKNLKEREEKIKAGGGEKRVKTDVTILVWTKWMHPARES